MPVEPEENVRRVNRALARPYTLDKSLQAVPGNHPNPDHLGVSTGLISNVIDMAKYDAALDRRAFISEASQELAWTPAVANSRETLPYGLGWFVQEFRGTKLVWHYGWEVTVGQLGIDEKVPLTEAEKQARVMDLLRARSGVYIPAAAETASMQNARPERGSHGPGTHWYYNNWDFNVLGTIFRQQTGDGIFAAFGKRIAEPLRMQDYAAERQSYSYEQNFSIHPAYPFLISARDMAKLGQLFLQQGRWDGRQIIPAAWIAESTRSYSQTGTPQVGYGYMWWIVTDDFCGMKDGDYYASGYGGQKLFVLPRINTLVVHRNNIYLPGVNIDYVSAAPFYLMPRILDAYTGQRQPTVAASTAKAVRPRRLLKDYAQIQRASAADYTAWRIILWACAVAFASWAALCTARSAIKRARSSRTRTNGTANGRPALVTVTRLVGSLVALTCTVYLLALLLFEGVLKFIAVNGVPPYLPAFYSAIVYVPLLAPAAAGLSLLVTILLWARRNGTLFERAHLTAFTVALIVFTWASCTLNLMPEWR